MSESTSQGLYTIDEQVTIRRGKRSGQTATVLDVNQADSVYAVRYADGGFGAVNHENVKARVEPTFTRAQIQAVLQAHGLDADIVLKDLDLSF